MSIVSSKCYGVVAAVLAICLVMIQAAYGFMPMDSSLVAVNGITAEVARIQDNGNGTATVSISVSVDNGRELNSILFSLPVGAVPTAPLDGAQIGSGRTYTVDVPVVAPFSGIRFETVGEGIKDGESDTFEFTVFSSAVPYDIQFIAITGDIEGSETLSVDKQPEVSNNNS